MLIITPTHSLLIDRIVVSPISRCNYNIIIKLFIVSILRAFKEIVFEYDINKIKMTNSLIPLSSPIGVSTGI